MTPKDLISDKSQHSKVSDNVAVEATAQKDILDQSKNVAVKILMLRYSLVFILVGLATGLGGGSFVILRYKEQSTFRAEFNSAAIQTKRSMTDHLLKTYVAADLIDAVYTGQLNTTAGIVLPYYTMPGFDNIVSGINQLSKSRITSLSPVVKNTSRLEWEQFAKDNVGSLHGPASLRISTNGSWIVSDGIFSTDSLGRQSTSRNFVPESMYPDLMFPIWQVAPLQMNAVAVMFDPHAKQGTRMFAIDRAISTMQGASTDIVQLVIDSSKYRPSTILYFPVVIPGSIPKTIGLIGMAFTWDEIFSHILPSYLNRVDCVVSTVTTSFTLALVNGAVTIIGRGDLHDRNFDEYATVISEGLSDSSTSLAGYTITLYPTTDLYSTYITTNPQNVCIGAVTIIVFTALVFTLYVYLVTIRQAQLEEVARRSLVMNTSRDAVLQSKKIYVRYISHEMRTPLNVAFLGLKLLIKDLSEGT
jgi:CHASE domain